MGRARLLARLVLAEPAFEECDGVAEVVVETAEQVDVVGVFLTAEAVGEVVARVDGGAHLAAMRADEAVVAFDDLGRWALTSQRGDGDGHGQIVANAAQQIRGNHGFSGVNNRRGWFPFASGVASGRG